MRSFSQFLLDNSHILLWILILALIALVIMGVVTFLTNRAIKKAATKKGEAPPPPPKVKKPPAFTKMPPLGGRLSEYLALKGYFRIGELSTIFLKGIEFLRKNIHSHSPLYHLPFYLLVGPSSCGKTTLFRASKLQLPLGEPNFGIEGDHDIKWLFLNRGVVLDVKGNFFINRHNDDANEGAWRTLLGLLSRYRAKRPIDGIILTISVDEFIGKHAWTHDEWIQRVKIIAQKIHLTQQNLGLQLPVYVVLTKSDLIPGFKSLCEEIPRENSGNILGWSNPYHLATAYNPLWVDQAFGFLKEFLSKLRLEIFANRETPTTQDGIFVFPSQIERVKHGLTTFLNQIFRDDSYSEGLHLRGIYFCGDGINHGIIETMETGDIREEDEAGLAGKREIFFFEDLLTEKVFLETGLAQPVRFRAARANRNLRIAKISTIALVTVGTFGLLHTYSKMRTQNEDMLPILSKINLILTQLQNVRGADSAETVALFDRYAKELIQMMHTLSESKFSSIFIPPSWFSPLQNNLKRSIKISYDHIILRTIYIDLLLKGRELLYLRPTPLDRSTSLEQVIIPIESVEFDLLRRYVIRVTELARMIDLFNELSKSNDITPLRDLVTFTFKTELPKSFESEFHNFRRVLRDIPFAAIDLGPYQALAQDTLRIVYRHFLDGVLSVTDPLSLVGRLNSFLREFGQKEQLPEVEELRKFAMELDQAVPKLGTGGKTWMDGDYFDIGPEFVTTIGLINDSILLGDKEMVAELASETAVVFNAFKAEMLRLLPIFSEETAVNSLVDLKNQVYPSQILWNLHRGLSLLFRESFMAPPPPNTLITVIPEHKVTYWDPGLIDAAAQMVKQFDTFKTKNLLVLPSTLREVILLIAQESLQQNILGTIARAQSFVDAPRRSSTGVEAEEVIRTKISNVKEVAPKFTLLLEALNRGGTGKSFIALRDLLAKLALRLLDQVETAAMSSAPYSIKEKNFSWWDGNPGAIYEAFNVHDMDDLQHYFTLQRDRMKHWALDFAKYLVDFLAADVMETAQFNRSLVDRWRRIILQILGFEQKNPDNSVTLLEENLIKLNDLSIKTCFTEIGIKNVRNISGDFFIAVDNMIRRELRARCEVLTRTNSIHNYDTLADFFNKYLRDKFPFVGNNLNANEGEAEPEDIREFFNLYREFGDNPKKIMAQLAELGRPVAGPYTFLKAMDKIKDFFQEFLDTEPDNNIPVFDLFVDFRVNRKQEQHANYVIDWTFKPSEETTISNHDKDRSARWGFGNPVQFAFRWPASAGITPALDEGQKFMNLVDQTAFFTFSSRWSLLWLLRVYGQPKPTLTEPTPYLLKFIVPTNDGNNAVLFTRITLRAPSKGKAPGRIMEVPIFPTEAPSISNQALSESEVPVLTFGKIMPSAEFMEEPQAPIKIEPAKKEVVAEKKPAPSTKEENAAKKQ